MNLQRFILNLYLVVCCVGFSVAQSSTEKSINLDSIVVSTESLYFTTDKLKNLYVIEPGFDVVKYNSKGQEVYRYSQNTLGTPSHIDSTDPFSLLLFYPDFQTLVLLDRTMHELSRINLSEMNFVGVKAVGLSSDHHVWVYDENSFQLKKIDAQGRVIGGSGDLSLVLPDFFSPDGLVERGLKVYAFSPDGSLYVFDGFGNFDKKLDLDLLEGYQVLEDKIVFFKGGRYFVYSLKSMLVEEISFAKQLIPSANFRIEKGRVYLGSPTSIVIYITMP